MLDIVPLISEDEVSDIVGSSIVHRTLVIRLDEFRNAGFSERLRIVERERLIGNIKVVSRSNLYSVCK